MRIFLVSLQFLWIFCDFAFSYKAEDVFLSLSIPLMSLVGLKTVEMAEEGRFSSIIMNDSCRTQAHSRVFFSDLIYCSI